MVILAEKLNLAISQWQLDLTVLDALHELLHAIDDRIAVPNDFTFHRKTHEGHVSDVLDASITNLNRLNCPRH